MLNIVVPMAGAGSRFSKAGYKDPKPLIKVDGYEMIRIVINNLMPKIPHRFIFICQSEHNNHYNLRNKLSEWTGNPSIICIDELTEGAACTVLKAADLIDNNSPLVIANSDQYIDYDINIFYDNLLKNIYDGLILTMKANDPKWSYVKMTSTGSSVAEVFEKKVISDEATVGIYGFLRGRDFVSGAKSMISKNLRVNNEFYVAPVYNEIIASGASIGIENIGLDSMGMYGLGTPEDLNFFLSHDVKTKALSKL